MMISWICEQNEVRRNWLFLIFLHSNFIFGIYNFFTFSLLMEFTFSVLLDFMDKL